ncbi:hypothetical protein JSE7799_03188 [Jannaschia seosinensis]|uniref:DUF2141 domain-containing protein n=2 Tax=Jannaschia seosinensis TaxID=313367 RepID=A0A0M7BGI6_9RHOB|nr:hypothetical protein JSE7799_03188 [Jannaschia seosinensis]
MGFRKWLVPAAALLLATPAFGGDVRVEIANLRSGDGMVRVAICPRETFTQPSCPYVGAAPASRGAVVIEDVPDGVYAVQAFHDENGNGDLDRRRFRPAEGLGFSRDARMWMGPPRFSDAAIRVTGDGMLTLTMRYYQ